LPGPWAACAATCPCCATPTWALPRCASSGTWTKRARTCP
jgi:hypothetical protein